MTSEQLILLLWMIGGFINCILLYIVFKYYPEKVNEHTRRGVIYQMGLVTLWFTFGIIIIPFIIFNTIRKVLAYKLTIGVNKLQDILTNMQKELKKRNK